MTNPYDADRRYVVSDPYLLATLRAYLVNAARWPMRSDDSLWDSEHQSTELPFNRAQFLAALRGQGFRPFGVSCSFEMRRSPGTREPTRSSRVLLTGSFPP